MSEWVEHRLGEVCSRLSSGSNITAKDIHESGSFPVFGGNGIRGYAAETNFSGECAIIGRQGAYCGNVRYFIGEARMSEHAIVACAGPSHNTRFLAYLLSNMNLGSLSGQAAQPGLSVKVLAQQSVRMPSRHTQERVAEILGAYDDLIEVNRRRITVLEEMARGLFEEWFVRFRFPGHQTVPILDTPNGPLPEGWSISPLREAAILRSGFAFKSSTFVDDGPYSLVTIKHVQDGVLAPPFQSRLLNIPASMPDHCYIQLGDTLLSLTGNVGRVCLAWGNGLVLNQRVAKIDCIRSSLRAYVYYWFRRPQTLRLLQQIANGAAQQNLSPVQTMERLILLPPDNIAENFEKITGPMMHKTTFLYLTNENLQRQRDLLLPRLISGQLSVAEADRQLEKAV